MASTKSKREFKIFSPYSILTKLILLLFCLYAPYAAANSNPDLHIDFLDGFVSISANDVSLSRILKEISQIARIKIIVGPNLDYKIDYNCKNAPMKKALLNLIEHHTNNIIIYKSSKIEKLYVFSKDYNKDPDLTETDDSGPEIYQTSLEKPVTSQENQKSNVNIEELLESESKDKRIEAIEILEDFEDNESLETLISLALNDENEEVRESAVDALAVSENGIAVEPLIFCLNDWEADVRAAAADGLGDLKDPQAIQPLTEALYDPDDFVRESAQKSIQRIESPNIILER